MLAEGEFYRVGGQSPLQVDVRVIAATHQDLAARVREGGFREDLYHRLNVIRIELPPLRARREDVPELMAHYLRVAAQELGVEPKSLSAETAARLADWHWPGNVRELVNLCRRLSVLAPGTEIHVDDLPDEMGGGARAPGDADWIAALTQWAERQPTADGAPWLDSALPAFERALIRVALRRSRGHKQDAAKILGWGRNTLTRKLRELDLGDDGP